MPTISSVHVNRPLTNIAVAFVQGRTFLANSVFPMVPVTKKSDSFFTFTASDLRRAHSLKRAEGTEAAIADLSPSTSTYTAVREALKHRIPDPTRANADAPLDLDRIATELVVSDVMRGMEVKWVAKFFTTSTWTGSSSGSDITPGVTWDNDTSTPIEDIRTQIRALEQNTGYAPNRLVLGRKVFDDLLDHPDVLDRAKYTATATGPAGAPRSGEQLLGNLLGIERVLVGRASRDTAAEGTAASNAFIAGQRNALLVYAAPSPAIMAPSGGYTFVWNGAGNDMGIEVKSYREPEALESDAVEANIWYDNVLISASLGAFFSNAVAA